MKIHRFIGTSNENGTITDRNIIHQIGKVLKLTPGEYIELIDGTGIDYQGKIKKIQRDEIYLEEIKKIAPTIPNKKVSLYCALLKKENFELVCQKATEIGVSKIVPILTERTIKQGIKIERLEKIIQEATEQSGLSLIPHISPIKNFKEALEESLKDNKKTLLFDSSGKKLQNTSDSIGLFIGPEGGFSDEEIEYAKNLGIEIGSLGKTTLRGETAGIIATYWALQ